MAGKIRLSALRFLLGMPALLPALVAAPAVAQLPAPSDPAPVPSPLPAAPVLPGTAVVPAPAAATQGTPAAGYPAPIYPAPAYPQPVSPAGAPVLTPPPVLPSPAEPAATPAPAAPAAEKHGHFFDHIQVRGYTQLRYNQLLATNDRLVNLQGDRSVGQDAGLLIRRARLVFSGDIHPQVAMYLQTDFAANAGDTLNVGQIRDWYFDIAFDAAKEFRVRVGDSKVPYGFENMQSSSNRLPLDRSDALNSAAPGERDLGLFFYYAPAEIRKRFKHLVDSGLKGSGDYGVVGVGVYEGQAVNAADANTNKHVVGRLAYPFQIGDQILEAGLQGYTGKFVVRTDPGILVAPQGVRDARGAASLVLYPQPFGLQLEYNIGAGPELHNLTAQTDEEGDTTYTGTVDRHSLHGGYALVSYKIDDVIPFVRAHHYEGGKKQERNAPRYSVKELEIGAEWQVVKALELTAEYTIARRTDGGRLPYNLESGRFLRLQLQANY